MARQDHRSGSQTVVRALELLECFSIENSTWNLTELSNRTRLTVPTTHRLLKSLLGQGFLVVDPESKNYSLGPAVMQLASALTQRGNIHAEALPEAQRLRRRSGETVSLHLLVDDERVCILELVSRMPIRMSSGLGHRYPLHRGAAGKAILSALSAVDRGIYCDRHTQEPERSWIEHDLDACQERGFALSESEVFQGAVSVAAVIRGADNRPLGALNVTGPASRWSLVSAEEFASEVLGAVETIESNLRTLGSQ
jgi:DNA-binding IclR family transcriptional regulator